MNILILFVLIFASTAEAANNYYVSQQQGNDAYNCALAQNPDTPKLTIVSGATCLQPGDTLFVRAGVYIEALPNVIPSGTLSAPVTVTAYADDTVTIRPLPQRSVALTFSGADRAYIVIDRINIDCVNALARCIGIYEGAHHIRIRNAEVKHFSTGVAAIEVEEGANCEFSTLNVHHNQGGGFFLNQSNNVVMQTQIHDNAGVGITVWNTANTLIYNNIIFDNAPFGAIAVTSYANGTMIINNTLRGSLNNYGCRNNY